MRVSVTDIEDVVVRALEAHGARAWQATEVARAVARSEALGNIICGLYYLESYCSQLRSGRVDGTVEPVVTRPRPGSVLSDALSGFAQPAFSRGIATACDAARENGTASFAVTGAHTCTSLGYFTERIAAEGFIGIGFTSASPVVVPPGGTKKTIGTNPIAMSVPGQENPRLHFDFSTSAVALGKITMAKAAGETIPIGWAVDADGNPTDDPAHALEGGLVSAGGHKGWGFGLMAEILAAGVAGGVNSLDVSGLKLAEGPPHRLGQFYLLIDPGTYGDWFDARFDRLADFVAMQEGARLPGAQREVAAHVDVPDELWRKSTSLAAGG